MRAKALLLFLLVGTGPLFAQTQPVVAKGYLSFEYQDGQRFSAYPEGTFGNVQAGLQFFGPIENVFAYNLEVRFKKETSVEIEEAWVGIQQSEAFQLKLGFYLVPFGKYNQANRPHETPFIQPPLPVEALYPASWREVGIQTGGRTSAFTYAFYLGNGLREAEDLSTGQQFKDNNGDIAAGGRIGAFLSQGFEVGFSYYRGHYDDEGKRNLQMLGVDATWNTAAVLLVYEYERALMDNPAGFERGQASGHYVLLSLNIGDFSPVVSYQALDYKDPFHGSGFIAGESAGAGISENTTRWMIGLVYRTSSAILLKLEYDLNREDIDERENNVFLAQVALHF